MSLPVADRRPALPPVAVSWWLFLLPAMLGMVLGVAVRGDRRAWGDVAVLRAIERIDWPGVRALVTLSNTVFDTGGAVVLALLLVATALIAGRHDLIVQVGVVAVLRAAGQVLKSVFDSPRPGIEYQPDPSLVSHTLGYPSGHAYTATVVAGMMIAFVSVLDMPRRARWAVSVVAALLTLLALFARVHIGAHWPSDTVGGVLFGIATIGLMQLIVGRLPMAREDAARRAGIASPTRSDDGAA